MRDLHHNIKVSNALDTQAISTNTTTNGEVIDTRDFDTLEFAIKAGAVTDGNYTPLIEHSDVDTFGGEQEAVADKFLLGTEAEAQVDAANEVKKIGYVGHKRYVRLSIVSAGTTSGGTLGAMALQTKAHLQPVD